MRLAIADRARISCRAAPADFGIISRECPATFVETSISGVGVARELDRIAEIRGNLCMVVSDNHCPAGNCEATAERGHRVDLERHPEVAGGAPCRVALHRAGQAHARHGFVESFNGRLRDECLNDHLFAGLRHARHLIAAWRDDYNYHRPHHEPRRAYATGLLQPVSERPNPEQT
jgi:putative transposase